MNCISFHYAVQKSLISIFGVDDVKATLLTRPVIVLYDSVEIYIVTLIKATTDVGYPSSLRRGRALTDVQLQSILSVSTVGTRRLK